MGDNINVNGHVEVGRDVAVGGRVAVQGDMTVGHGLSVKGWLDAPNIKGANKGVFSTLAKLQAAYPIPHEGWYAGVIDSSDVVLYIADGGEWTSTSADYTGSFDAPEKADKASGGTEDNFAALDAEGNLKDSGHKDSDYATAAQGAKADTAYQKPGDGIPKSDLASEVQSSLDKADTALQNHQDISGKADKVSGGTENNFAALDAEGNLKDSGHKDSDYATAAQGAKADTAYNSLTTLNAAVTTAQEAKTAAEGYASDASAAKIAAQSAQRAAETAASNAAGAAGLAIGEAVRCEYYFSSPGKKTLSKINAQLMVVNGVGTTENTYELADAGNVIASFIFADPKEIPQEAFKAIAEIKNVHIPSFVHKIGDNAFNSCTGIANIDCEAMTPPTVGTNAFDNTDTGQITVTVHSIVAADYANWGGFSNIATY